ncbi:catalase family peroxidase [Aurantimonas sp. A2-1-M11]|uniref:catalase family peroxidase n=1 Tax=Aurantimonas sp. A2-1-M11 TaxID=3113712 RepID=UPI002F95FC22
MIRTDDRKSGDTLRRAAGCIVLAAAIGIAAPASAQKSPAGSGQTEIARGIVDGLDKVFGGPYAGHRAAHAQGILLDGMFRPSGHAASLTRAEHLTGSDVPVLVRFSDFAGMPEVPDHDGAANPKGMAIKFLLPDGGSTDIVVHSFDGFAAQTPAEFRDFVQALGSKDPQVLADHLAAHPAARRFVDTPKPAPVSYATEAFFGVNAFAFTNAAGESRFGKYRLVPEAGVAHLSEAETKERDADYLSRDMAQRMQDGPVRFRLLVQLAGEGDSLTRAAFPWPKDREEVELGTFFLTGFAENAAARQRDLLFTPLSLVGGIAPSDDPMLISRTRSYRLSHDRRRTRDPVVADSQ